MIMIDNFMVDETKLARALVAKYFVTKYNKHGTEDGKELAYFLEIKLYGEPLFEVRYNDRTTAESAAAILNLACKGNTTDYDEDLEQYVIVPMTGEIDED